MQATGGLPAGLVQSAPVGRSDNRTNSFNLVAGQSYLNADLGYAPPAGSATIGDLVWSDADGDGFRDPGEPGLAGVTVQLYLDDGTETPAVFEPGTDDTLVATTVTAAGGAYLFTGVTAGGTETYWVYIDPAPTGYTLTTAANPILTAPLNPDDVFLTYDFGFRNDAGTHFIKDRVWFDVDEDEDDDAGVDDNGESGISGVTVDLLDASLNVIASTTTDAGGYFTFTGVPGNNADYTVRITDTDGVLADYFPTTAEAVTGEVDIVNLAGDVDFTVEPGEPNFGYNLSGSIGDTVFNDIDGSGGAINVLDLLMLLERWGAC